MYIKLRMEPILTFRSSFSAGVFIKTKIKVVSTETNQGLLSIPTTIILRITTDPRKLRNAQIITSNHHPKFQLFSETLQKGNGQYPDRKKLTRTKKKNYKRRTRSTYKLVSDPHRSARKPTQRKEEERPRKEKDF